ncbi:MAG TPA: nodulation protein NfeD [Chthoniobacterales bacterium]
MKSLLPLCLAGLLMWTLTLPGWAANRVSRITIDGAIGPATADFVARATNVSAEAGDVCLIVQLDTPGGLLESTKKIVQSFYASKVPVVVFVAPTGANAGSAGCFITLAADVAAMASNTSIGAAHPVAIGGGGGTQQLDETMKQKLENFAISYIEAIAQKRGRNVEWAKSAVKESASITAEKALELKVIEIVATDQADLLRQLNGRVVRGKPLATADANLVEIPMLAREWVFQMLGRPEVMFLLMLIAIYGIIGELSNPGVVLPGIVGVIALILALYMAAVLPVNIAGVALIVLAVVLFVAEAFVPAFGALTAGGVIAFFLGALMLFEDNSPAFRLSLAMILPATLLTAAFFIFIVGAGLRAQRLPIRAGRETLKGRTAEALTDINEESGRVFVEGEDWQAVSNQPIGKGQPVEVVSVRGLTLTVRPITAEASS